MNRFAAFPGLLAILHGLPTEAQSPAQPPPAVEARPRLAASISAWLEGDWVGAGQFTRSGLPVVSRYEFRTVHDGEAMTVLHAEHAPNTFAWSGILSVDSRSGELILAMASNKGGGARVLRSQGWTGESLVFEASPELHAWFARERLTFERLDSGRFQATYEMSRDGGATWRSGDVQTFGRFPTSIKGMNADGRREDIARGSCDRLAPPEAPAAALRGRAGLARWRPAWSAPWRPELADGSRPVEGERAVGRAARMTGWRIAVIAAAGLGAVGLAGPAFADVDWNRANKVDVERTEHHGRPAIRVTDRGGGGDDRMVFLNGAPFSDGEICLRMAGARGPRAAEDDRGFVGVAFRASPDFSRFEGFYLRPANGRADDQVRRNRSVQYHSLPDHPWDRLRREAPGRYETYADLEPDVWTRMRVVVSGERARLYVGDAQEPTLIVNDLKLGPAAEGGVALWVGPGTVAHFTDIRVRGPGGGGSCWSDGTD